MAGAASGAQEVSAMSDFMSRARELGDLLWRKARQGGEAAAEALEQQASIQRLAGQARKLNRDRMAVYGDIGTKVYALHRQGKVRNQDVMADCQRVDAIGDEMARIRQQIEDIRTASLAQGVQLPPLEDAADLTEEGPPIACAVDQAKAPVVTGEADEDDYVGRDQDPQPDSCSEPGTAPASEAAAVATAVVEAGDDDYVPRDLDPAPDGCSAPDGEQAEGCSGKPCAN
jgi:hypothetical protein